MKLLKLTPLCLALAASAAYSDTAATVFLMSGEYFSGWADILMPLQQTPSHNLYTDLQVQGSDSYAGIVSFGAGYRQARNNHALWGTYLFIDRERSSDKVYFNVASPGAEYLTNTWQFRANAYVPFGDTKQVAQEGWADQMGDFSYVKFSGHQELDRIAYNYQSLSYGGDVSASYRLPNHSQWEFSLTPYAYHFDENSNMTGGKCQITYYPKENLSLFLGDTYDNKNKNIVLAGVSLNFGDRSTDNRLSDLMTSPVYRNLDVNTSGDGIPVDNYTTIGGTDGVEVNNIYFVKNGYQLNQSVRTLDVSTPDGTYEDKYTSIDQISNAPDNAKIWIANTGKSYTSNGTVTLSGTQTIEGRSSNFKYVANGADRPTITSEGLVITSANDVANLKLLGEGYNSNNEEQAGITINSSSDSNQVAQITNVKIGSTDADTSFQNGIWMNSGAKASVQNAKVIAYLNEGQDSISIAQGIAVEGDDTLTVNNSTIETTTIDEAETAFGFFALGDNKGVGNITITNSTVTSVAYGGNSYGVADGLNDLTITSSTITANSYILPGGNPNLRSAAVDTYNADATITYNTLISNSDHQAGGLEVDGGTTDHIDFENNTLNINGEDFSYGVFDGSTGGTASITDNTFNLTSSTSGGTTIAILDPYDDITQSDNTFNLTGDTVHEHYP